MLYFRKYISNRSVFQTQSFYKKFIKKGTKKVPSSIEVIQNKFV